ncbi:MAG: DUF2818 family protein [Burkholderiales bacterium]|jgi:hypothetical protein|nr:DUF2818 family protein [Burkholderiales bacterium]MCA3162759.1 DUF2818 family protein [Burkholderiales bacterium]MCA3163067.1 DUF2818 family protein [Burkholderiales bacterium]MCA3165004.1 DUF2818 family protein [Burkholderiales bacterium]MCA3169676.1 DUF2818 family protein [Burkholderiales bacterium]
MQNSAALWLMIVLAIAAANLPFINERLLGLWKLFASAKPFWVRLLELLGLYAAVGLLAWLTEDSQSAVHAQGWQFYVTTFCLFLVAAYPGYLWRYLWRRQQI